MKLNLTNDSKVMFAFLLAFVVAFALTPFVKRLAYKIGAVDVPKDNRRMHKQPKARLGGLAIFLGFVVSVCIFTPLPGEVIGVLLGSTIVVVLGIFDDIYALSAKLKFVIQIIAATVPLFFGVVIETISVPTFINETGVIQLGWVGYPLTVLWIVAITNAVNLIDGLDGLAIGVSTISAFTLLCASLIYTPYMGSMAIVITVLCASLSGACLGFFPYNFNPAKLFMGDTGALFLGYTLSSISVMGLFKGYAAFSVAAPVLILALPIFDTSFAILRRLKNHQPIMAPDRGHLHHRLIDHGLSQKQAVAFIYALCIALCLFAIFLLTTGAIKFLLLAIIVVLCVVFIIVIPRIMKSFNDEEKNENK